MITFLSTRVQHVSHSTTQATLDIEQFRGVRAPLALAETPSSIIVRRIARISHLRASCLPPSYTATPVSRSTKHRRSPSPLARGQLHFGRSPYLGDRRRALDFSRAPPHRRAPLPAPRRWQASAPATRRLPARAAVLTGRRSPSQRPARGRCVPCARATLPARGRRPPSAADPAAARPARAGTCMSCSTGRPRLRPERPARPCTPRRRPWDSSVARREPCPTASSAARLGASAAARGW